MHVAIRLSFAVHDREKLFRYAAERVKKVWGDDEPVPTEVARAVLEATVLSNSDVPYADMGLELLEAEATAYKEGVEYIEAEDHDSNVG